MLFSKHINKLIIVFLSINVAFSGSHFYAGAGPSVLCIGKSFEKDSCRISGSMTSAIYLYSQEYGASLKVFANALRTSKFNIDNIFLGDGEFFTKTSGEKVYASYGGGDVIGLNTSVTGSIYIFGKEAKGINILCGGYSTFDLSIYKMNKAKDNFWERTIAKDIGFGLNIFVKKRYLQIFSTIDIETGCSCLYKKTEWKDSLSSVFLSRYIGPAINIRLELGVDITSKLSISVSPGIKGNMRFWSTKQNDIKLTIPEDCMSYYMIYLIGLNVAYSSLE